MAKSKSFFGLRSGSTKTLTFQVYDGTQITKDRVAEVKNPRSMEQMVMRFRSKSVVSAYSLMKKIENHAFEGTAYGLKSYAKFLSLNLNAIKNGAKFFGTPYGQNIMGPGEFIVSTGSIKNPLAPTRDAGLLNDTSETLLQRIPGNASGVTVGEIHEYLGLGQNDFLTIVSPQFELDENREFVKNAEFLICRIYRSDFPDDTVIVDHSQFTEIFKVEKNFGNGDDDYENDQLGINLKYDSDNEEWQILMQMNGSVPASHPRQYGTILSKKSDGKWLRSSCQLRVDGLTVPTGNVFATYPAGKNYILNGGEYETISQTAVNADSYIYGSKVSDYYYLKIPANTVFQANPSTENSRPSAIVNNNGTLQIKSLEDTSMRIVTGDKATIIVGSSQIVGNMTNRTNEEVTFANLADVIVNNGTSTPVYPTGATLKKVTLNDSQTSPRPVLTDATSTSDEAVYAYVVAVAGT